VHPLLFALHNQSNPEIIAVSLIIYSNGCVHTTPFNWWIPRFFTERVNFISAWNSRATRIKVDFKIQLFVERSKRFSTSFGFAQVLTFRLGELFAFLISIDRKNRTLIQMRFCGSIVNRDSRVKKHRQNRPTNNPVNLLKHNSSFESKRFSENCQGHWFWAFFSSPN
jgi:hypothetical protein